MDQLAILLVEDNPGDARLIREMLRETSAFSCTLDHAARLGDALAYLQERAPDVVLLDLSLPDSHGLDTFLRVQQQVPAVPIVVLTGLNDETVALSAVHAGAQDYLVKNEVQSTLLVRSLRYAIERKRLVLELEAERTWLRTIIDRSPVGILLVEGRQGERIVANRRAEELFGFALAPARGVAQCIEFLCDAAGKPLPYEATILGRALAGEAVPLEEGMLWRMDGREIPVAMSAGPIRDVAGQLLGAVVILEDLTPLRELEQLRRQWISVVAHELRGAAAIISLQSNALRLQTPEDPRAARTIENILSTAHQLSRMVSDLLDFSRIEAQQMRIEPKPVQLGEVVETVVQRLADTFAGRPVQVRGSEALPLAYADATRLEQVFINLLSNAAKYGAPGTSVAVDLEHRGMELEIAVRNRGAGIPPDELPHLFTRFFRSQRVRQEGITGLGLGLYITRGLVEAHGGRIWAESNPGQETVFRFTLPVAHEGAM